MILTEIKVIQDYLQNNENDSNKIQSLYAMNYIYDDEFVSIINSLSGSIKDFFKSTRASIGTIKKSSDLILDEILISKSSISEVFMQVDSCLIGKYTQNKPNNVAALSKEKNIKDKLNQIVEKLEEINEIRTQMSKNTKTLEQNCSKFYDEAKIIFKNMKSTRNQRLEELNNMNFFASGALTNLKNFHNNNVINNNNNNIHYNTAEGFRKNNFSPDKNKIINLNDNNNYNYNDDTNLLKMANTNYNFFSNFSNMKNSANTGNNLNNLNNFPDLNVLKSQERIKDGPSK
jgi:hypothetical protein